MVCSMVATRLTFERKKSKFGLIFLFLDAYIVRLPINSMWLASLEFFIFGYSEQDCGLTNLFERNLESFQPLVNFYPERFCVYATV